VESSVWDLLVLFAWLTVADFAKRTNESPSLVFGIGWPFYTLPFAAGTFASSFSPGSVSTAAIALLMLVLLITAMACLETRDQDTKQLFAEASEEAQAPTRPSDYDNIDDRCKQIAEQYSLTPRELDVMQLLCKGRTKAYIAETLFLTENTVRGHTKHLYTKLDVHSKQELLDLIGCA
jgi:DNA-binding NarL/FixJ family response regulator